MSRFGIGFLSFFLLIVLVRNPVTAQQKTKHPKDGIRPERWFCQLAIQDKTIDFFLSEVRSKGVVPNFILANGKEKIELKFNRLERDTLFCPVSVFDAELVLPLQKGREFQGYFLKNNANKMFFKASSGWEIEKPPNPVDPAVSGQWRIRFYDNGIQADSGLLVLNQKQDSLYGTILSETGDFRFLNGRAGENKFYLQTFDGGHTYRFDFQKDGSKFNGRFLYGPAGYQDVVLEKSQNQSLKDGFSLTSLKKEEKFSWLAKDDKGDKIDNTDPRWQGKALVIQVMGSWCPNCLDETRFLTEAWKSKPSDVEIVALAFERKPGIMAAYERINAVKNRLGVPYPIFWGGMSQKDSALKAFRGIEKIPAYPTTIFVKKDGTVYKVHSGFSGPATGIHYEAWKKEFSLIMSELSR
jgi:thiol-disulfide isomerase/thioredoxin